MSGRPCNELAQKRCCECGRRGVKAFHRMRKSVGFHEVELWCCSNRGRCGTRGFDVQAAMDEWFAAYQLAAGLVRGTS